MAIVPSAVDSSWLTQADYTAQAIPGEVVNPIYPGPITEDHSGGPETIPGRDPVGGQSVSPLPVDDDSDDVSGGGGGFPDHDTSGHSGPIADFDAQGMPFAGSGPIAPTHDEDTGGVERRENVPVPVAKGWRRVLNMGTTNKQAYTYTPEGFQVNSPNDRTQDDQYQGDGANGYAPAWVPYSERPLHANLAHLATPVTTPAGAYVAPGGISDMELVGSGGNVAYESPADPFVIPSSTADGPQDYAPVSGGDVGLF
jgi:hypothetical protein